MVLLLVSELNAFLTIETRDRLSVDTSRSEKLKINFDIMFPHIPCSLLSVDAMDVSGAHQVLSKFCDDRSLHAVGCSPPYCFNAIG